MSSTRTYKIKTHYRKNRSLRRKQQNEINTLGRVSQCVFVVKYNRLINEKYVFLEIPLKTRKVALWQ